MSCPMAWMQARPPATSDLNRLREKVLLQDALAHAADRQGVFTLPAPTGVGWDWD